MKKLISFCILFLMHSSVYAQMFTWEDSRGLHASNNINDVPEQFRPKNYTEPAPIIHNDSLEIPRHAIAPTAPIELAKPTELEKKPKIKPQKKAKKVVQTKPMFDESSLKSGKNDWIKIATWGNRTVFYDKKTIITINPDEKEVIYCVVDYETSVVMKVRINRKTNKSAIGWNESKKRNIKVSEFDFSKFGWVYTEIAPKSAESILVRKLWR